MDCEHAALLLYSLSCVMPDLHSNVSEFKDPDGWLLVH